MMWRCVFRDDTPCEPQTRMQPCCPGSFLCPRAETTTDDTQQAFRRQAHFLALGHLARTDRATRSRHRTKCQTSTHLHPRAPLGVGGSFFARPGRRRSRAAAMRSRHAPDPGLQVGASGRPRPGLVGPGDLLAARSWQAFEQFGVLFLQRLEAAAQLGEVFARLDALLAGGGRGLARLVQVAAQHRA